MPSVAKVSYALFASAVLVLLAGPQSSSALSHTGPQPNNRVRHAQQLAAGAKKRMVKRQKLPVSVGGGDDGNGNGNGNGGGGGGGGGGAQAQSSTSAAGGGGQARPSSTSQPAPSSTSQPPANAGSASATSAQSAAPSSAVASVASAPSASSAAPSSATPTSTTPSSFIVPTLPPPSTLRLASTIHALPTASSTAGAANTANSFGKNSIIAIVVIASCVGGAAAIWTLIRKWKLGPSAKFEDRMQPIEWSPEADSGLPGAGREKDGTAAGEKSHRPGSTGSAGSFRSGDPHAVGRNVTGNANMFADQHPSAYEPTHHDFTAVGPAYPANDYNAGGYVDLHRSNSGHDVQPTYPNDYDYNAGQQPYGGAAYDREDAYAQDAYGGYETYGQPQHQYPDENYGHPQYSNTGAPEAAYPQSGYPAGRY